MKLKTENVVVGARLSVDRVGKLAPAESETTSFSSASLCLSRACLGKTDRFYVEMAPERSFAYLYEDRIRILNLQKTPFPSAFPMAVPSLSCLVLSC